MTDFANLEQMVHAAWGCARQARQFARMAHTRATLTRQAVRRACDRPGMAWLAPSMPKADARTRCIAATVLPRNGSQDEKPAIRASAGGARRSAVPTRPAGGGRR